MADEKKQTIKLQFAAEQTSPTLDINNGDYDRKFDVKDQPFECEPEEAAMLLRTPFFVVASGAKPKKPRGGAEADAEQSAGEK